MPFVYVIRIPIILGLSTGGCLLFFDFQAFFVNLFDDVIDSNSYN